MHKHASYKAIRYEDVSELQSFMMSNLMCGNLTINLKSDDFYANSEITLLDNGARFMTMEACGYSINHSTKDKRKGRDLYIIYSEYTMSWEGHGKKNRVPYKDSFFVDSSQDFYIESLSRQKTKSFGIPFSMLSDSLPFVIDSLIGKKLSSIKFGDEINSVMSTACHDCGLEERVNILINFIKLISYSEKVKLENKKYNYIVEKINSNIMDESFSLIKLSNVCDLSPRTIQYILSSHNTTFNKLISDIRLSLLCDNINKFHNKPLNEIVFLSGYNSFATAARHFKSKYGKSIKEYSLERK